MADKIKSSYKSTKNICDVVITHKTCMLSLAKERMKCKHIKFIQGDVGNLL